MDLDFLIPSSLRLKILDALHEGHQGITKCREMAKQTIWWPGLSKQIAELVGKCQTCCQLTRNRPEPLVPSEMLDGPWQTVGSDLFGYFYSRYIEIARLSKTSSAMIIMHMKSIFARHGVPLTLVSDNGPQLENLPCLLQSLAFIM